MSGSAPQRTIDEFHDTSAQQWVFRLLAVVTALGAVLAAAAVNERPWPAGLFIVGVLAAASAVRPDNHTALVVVVIVVWHWLATVDDVDTPWLPVAAFCLLVYHTVIALSASFPIGTTCSPEIIGRWGRRTAITACATVGMWLFVVLLDGRGAPGNGLLTALALAFVGGGAAMIRSRSLGPR